MGAWLISRFEHTGQRFNVEKGSSGDKLEQRINVQCIVFFNLVKLNIRLKKITHLE